MSFTEGLARSVSRPLIAALGLLLVAGCATKPEIPMDRPEPAWQHSFEHPIAFHTLVGDALLVVGTTRHLYAVDPETGERLWRLRNVSSTRRDVLDVPDASFILINDAAGGAFKDRGTYMLAVDRKDGSLHWESPVVDGRILQARLDLERERVYAVTVPDAHGDDTGLLHDVLPGKGLGSGFEREPRIVAIDLADGTRLWGRRFGQPVSMRPSYRPGIDAATHARVFDLGLYHPPVLVKGQVCVTYSGIRCYDGQSGKTTWSHELDVLEWDLGLSYPNPVATDERLIAGDTERLYGFEPLSGNRQWRSDEVGRMPELLDGGIMLYAQIGGRYFDLEAEEWEAHGDFGVAAFNKRNGNILWKHERLDDSISNVLLVEPYVWVADSRHVYALDRLDGTVAVRERHGLKEPPNYVLLNRERNIVLLSETEAAGYKRSTGERLWYHYYEPAGPGAWKRFAGALLSASGAIFKWSSALIAHGSGLLPSMPYLSVAGAKVIGSEDVLEGTAGAIGEGLTDAGATVSADNDYANLTGRTRYFVTEVDYHDEVALASVNLDTGKKRGLTALPSQAANLEIDEFNGRAYQAEGNALFAVPLGQRRPQAAGKAATAEE